MLKAQYCRYNLIFKEPGGTSRGVLSQKETYFIKISDDNAPSIFGMGECALFRGLSADDRCDYEAMLKVVCDNIHQIETIDLSGWSSIRFGVETALSDLDNGGKRIVFSSPFTMGQDTIEINGLIWMGDKAVMSQRIEEKLDQNFRCVKLKIGAIDFDAECELLHYIRSRFSPDVVELRVDANGAFAHEEDAMKKIERLSQYHIHSIEQPIKQKQWELMAKICRNSPIPVALDEELIGVASHEKESLLLAISPQYIVLKPALIGGFAGSDEWIELANRHRVGWWVTSALESNIGLNAIAQWCYTKRPQMPQGLGTGQLYTNNIKSPLSLMGASLYYDNQKNWDTTILPFSK